MDSHNSTNYTNPQEDDSTLSTLECTPPERLENDMVTYRDNDPKHAAELKAAYKTLACHQWQEQVRKRNHQISSFRPRTKPKNLGRIDHFGTNPMSFTNPWFSQ